MSNTGRVFAGFLLLAAFAEQQIGKEPFEILRLYKNPRHVPVKPKINTKVSIMVKGIVFITLLI